MPLTNVKTAAFTAMAKAMDKMATIVKPGALIIIRAPYRMSCLSVRIIPPRRGFRFQVSGVRFQTGISGVSPLLTPDTWRLFVSERDQRVHLRRPPRRDPTGQQRDQRQQGRNQSKRRKIS